MQLIFFFFLSNLLFLFPKTHETELKIEQLKIYTNIITTFKRYSQKAL